MAIQDTGSWGSLKDWPLIGLHSIVTQDGKVLTFGTDSNGMQSGAFIYDLWDPVTDTHTTLDNKTATDIFCSAAIILPGTNQIVIGGGDGQPQGATNTGVDDVNFFDNDDYSLTQSTVGEMNFARWYPTMVSLPSGQLIILGGRGGKSEPGVAVPEIFTEGEGWRKLDGAADPDLVPHNSYPRAFVNGDGNIVYFASGKGTTGATEVRVLDPSGNGSLETIATLPFNHGWATPAIMYEAGKVLISATNGDMWTMDITGSTPVFTQTESLSQLRNWSDLTVMADGKVLVNGGTSNGNKEAGSDKTAAIWDPETGTWDYTVDEINPRLYHSGSVLLADGTILSLGGGAAGSSENNYIDAQIYKPPYLYDDNGQLATRPIITGAPEDLIPGETFTIQADSTISKMTLVKNGAATHSFNMEARMVNLEYVQDSNGTITVTLPENANEVTAGSWMLFAFDENGVPAQAPIVAIQPTLAQFDGIGDVTAEYFAIDAGAASLDQIDFDGTILHREQVLEIKESGNGAFYPGGPADDFAIQYTGEFFVSKSGNHTFHLTSDDGSRLFIDGEMVIDNDGVFAATHKTAIINLSAGVHEIELRYFEQGGPGSVDLDWSGPGFNRTQMRFDGAKDNLLVNGGLEKANLSTNTPNNTTDLPGWSTTNNIELWSGGFLQNADSSLTLAEIDAINGTLSQSVDTSTGQKYDLEFSLAGRQGAIASSGVEVLWNGDIIATIDPKSANFERYAFELTGTGGSDTLAFRSKTGDTDGLGGLLDSVVLTLGDTIVDPTPKNIIDGTNGDDYLFGTDDDDLIQLFEGRDVVEGSAGNDVIIGSDSSYDQVDYDGSSADYNFKLNSDGSVTVTKPDNSTDVLTSVDGFWFKGEAVWKPLEDILKDSGNPLPGQTITGTSGDDYLAGFSGDDVIYALAGEDVIQGSTGSDSIEGGGDEYDQVDYSGSSADYTFTSNGDGTISAQHKDGDVDTLRDIDGIWFAGDGKWSPIEDLVTGGTFPDQVINGTSVDDFISGSPGNDTINGGAGLDVIRGSRGDDVINGGDSGYNQVDYSGAASDFIFVKNTDGSYTATSDNTGTDQLIDIGGIWFEGEAEWYDIDDLLA